MTRAELIKALDRLNVETGSIACLGCGHEHNCSTQGCAIIRAAVEELEKMRWIPAKENQPVWENSDWVIGVANGKRHVNAITMVCYDRDEDTWFLDASPETVVSVSHWMPLPEPPEVSEDG